MKNAHGHCELVRCRGGQARNHQCAFVESKKVAGFIEPIACRFDALMASTPHGIGAARDSRYRSKKSAPVDII